MSVTDIPKSAARNAAAYPPGPAPTTAMLRDGVSDMVKISRRDGACNVSAGSAAKAEFDDTAGRDVASYVSTISSSLHRQQEWLLKRFGDPSQEARRVGSVNQAVIIGERQRQNQPRLELAPVL